MDIILHPVAIFPANQRWWNVYGQTKLEGELAVSQTLKKYFIVRIAWVFGLNGKNFIKTMLNVGKTHATVRVVNDQIRTKSWQVSRTSIDSKGSTYFT